MTMMFAARYNIYTDATSLHCDNEPLPYIYLAFILPATRLPSKALSLENSHDVACICPAAAVDHGSSAFSVTFKTRSDKDEASCWISTFFSS